MFFVWKISLSNIKQKKINFTSFFSLISIILNYFKENKVKLICMNK